METEIVLFDGFDELDAVGPFEVLRNAQERGGPFSVSLVTREPRDAVTASHGLRVEPDDVLGEPDLLLVPGGGWNDGGGVRREYESEELPNAIADVAGDGTTVASVCTGALLLASAGLLDGRPATTHHTALDDLDRRASLVDARVVDDGDVLTAGGVTAGLDLALWLAEREADPTLAEQIAETLEHDRSEDIVTP
jgi:transcriptional regulator GlxA family with amidase domain